MLEISFNICCFIQLNHHFTKSHLQYPVNCFLLPYIMIYAEHHYILFLLKVCCDDGFDCDLRDCCFHLGYSLSRKGNDVFLRHVQTRPTRWSNHSTSERHLEQELQSFGLWEKCIQDGGHWRPIVLKVVNSVYTIFSVFLKDCIANQVISS